jgi:hypothetical protein
MDIFQENDTVQVAASSFEQSFQFSLLHAAAAAL